MCKSAITKSVVYALAPHSHLESVCDLESP
jgi:hypothetical protein